MERNIDLILRSKSQNIDRFLERFSEKNQPDSLPRNRLDFSTEINPILCPEIDSIFRQNHLRSIIERCGQRILFATRSNVLALYILCLSRRTRTGALRRIATSCEVEVSP